MEKLRVTACYIDFDKLDRNVETLKQRTAGTEIMLVLKADAYGHGAIPLMKHFLEKGITKYAVASLNEALELRRAVRDGEILILGWTPDELLHYTAENNITQAVYTYEQAKILSDLGLNAKIHIKVDTGMNRLGFAPDEKSVLEIKKIKELPSLDAEGIFSHLAQLNADTDRVQYEKFEHFLKLCENEGITFKVRHLANGKNGIRHPHMRYDMIRSGSVLCGFCLNMPDVHVEPAMELKTKIARVHTVPAGEGIGYDLLDPVDHDRLVATLPFGYADGVPKSLSNHVGWVSIRGQKAEFCGNFCMDMCFADVTDIPGVQAGDDVTIYGGDGMDFFEVREHTGVGLSNLQIQVHKRVPRVYLQGGKEVLVVDSIMPEEE